MGCGDGLTAFLFILFVIDTTLIINRVRLHIAGWRQEPQPQRLARDGNLALVKVLLACKQIDPNGCHSKLASKDLCPIEGLTPLDAAANNGHVEIVKLMLSDERLDPSIVGADGETALEGTRVSQNDWRMKQDSETRANRAEVIRLLKERMSINPKHGRRP